MIDTLQDGAGDGLSGLIATSMPPEGTRPSWLQHPMRHLLKKIASGDTEEGAYPAESRGMLSTPIQTDFSQTNYPLDGGASAIRPAAVAGSQAAPLSAFGSLAPILPQPAPARPAAVPDAPAGIPAAVRRGMVGPPSTPPATSQGGATITVHAPGGSIFAFPAGTSAATINEAMSRHFGGTKSGASVSNFWESDPVVAQPNGSNFWGNDPIVSAKSDISANTRARPLTLNIEGRKVNVDDSFRTLSPEDQNKTVDEIHSSLSKRSIGASEWDAFPAVSKAAPSEWDAFPVVSKEGPNTASNADRSGSNTINVRGPDGSNFIFPAGTPTAEIHSALENHYGTATHPKFDKTDPRFSSGQASRMSELPPLPQGYALDALPPLPKGYKLDSGESAAFDKNDPRFSSGAQAGGKFLEGIPVLGAYVPQAGAWLSAAAHPLTGVGSDGATISERAAKNLEQEKAASEQTEKDNPVLSAALKMGGGTAALAPLGATGLGAKALGLTGETLAGRAGMGALSGAAIGGGDAAVRGEDVFRGVQGGAFVGGALPVAAKGVGSIFQKIAGRGMPEVAGSASPRVMRAINDDALDAPAIQQKFTELGPEATLADLGPNLRTQAEAVAATPGGGQKIVVDAMKNRADAAGGRIGAALDEHIGPTVNPTELTEQIIARRKTQAAPLYKEAYDMPITSNPEIESVLGTPFGKIALQKAGTLAKSEPDVPLGMFEPAGAKTASLPSKMSASEYQDWLAVNAAGKTQAPRVDVRGLDLVKRSLDDMHDQASRAGAGNRARVIDNLRKKLTTAVDTQAPKYAEARNIFSTESGIKDALEDGRNLFSKAMSPDELATTLKGLSGAEHDAFTQGARSAVADIMGSARNDAGAARALFSKGWTKEKLNAVLGHGATDALFKRLEQEATFHETSNGVLGNSRTAARIAAQGEFPSRVKDPTLPHGTTAIDAALFVPRKIGGAIVGNVLRGRADRIGTDAAKALMATGPARDQIVTELLRAQADRATTAARRAQLEKLITMAGRGSGQSLMSR